MNNNQNFKLRNSVTVAETGKSFVGFKVTPDSTQIVFPMGFDLPDDDNDLRLDIRRLINVLSAFLKANGELSLNSNLNFKKVSVPINAYIYLVLDFINSSKYYAESECRFVNSCSGKISWPRTIKTQKPLVQNNQSLLYLTFKSKANTKDINQKITLIHKYCVYDAFQKIGWLYSTFIPEKPKTVISIKESIYILNQKSNNTFNDKQKKLFISMKKILEYIDSTSNKTFTFGTDDSDALWEHMIDKAFGIKNKSDYYPRTIWFLDNNNNKTKKPLEPDTIMINDNKFYVIDAKNYRYGISGNPDHLPNGTDINKQITYAEYIFKVKCVNANSLFNCFIMPYNRNHNHWNINNFFENIGESIGEWRLDQSSSKPKLSYYERIQGILMDTKFILYSYDRITKENKLELIKNIEKVTEREFNI